MANLTIRVKLLILSGSLLALMIVSSLYMRSQIVAGSEALQISVQTLKTGTTALRSNSETLQAGSRALQSNNETIKDGNTTLQEDQILSSRLELAVQAQNAFGDLKYWLTDLAVSWLNESEENADTA